MDPYEAIFGGMKSVLRKFIRWKQKQLARVVLTQVYRDGGKEAMT